VKFGHHGAFRPSFAEQYCERMTLGPEILLLIALYVAAFAVGLAILYWVIKSAVSAALRDPLVADVWAVRLLQVADRGKTPPEA